MAISEANAIAILTDFLGNVGADLTQTSYHYAFNQAKITLGYTVASWGALDLSMVPDAVVPSLLEEAKNNLIQKLRNDYATKVDVKIGPREEKLSQTRTALDGLITFTIFSRPVTYTFPDFTLASGISNWPYDWWQRNLENNW